MKRILAAALLLCASLAHGQTTYNILDTPQTFSATKAGIVPASGGGSTNCLHADGTWSACGGGSSTPGGTSGQIQYNNGGTAFGGFGSFNGTDTVTVPKIVSTGSATVVNVIASGPSTFGAMVVNSINSPSATALTFSSNGASTAGVTVNNNIATYGNSIFGANGSSAALSYTFAGDQTTGFFWNAVTGQTAFRGSLFSATAGSSFVFSSGSNLGFSSGSTGNTGTLDAILTRGGPANIRHGSIDAAAPVAQTISTQSVVAGTSNTSGPAFTFQAPLSTGNATGGAFVFNSSYGGVSGTAQNAATQIFKIDPAGTLGPIATLGSGVGTVTLRATNNASLTASAPAIDVAQTLNNAAVVFTTSKINITNTASAAASLFFDHQISGTSIFAIGIRATAADPTLKFGGDTTTGWYRTAANFWAFSASGATNLVIGADVTRLKSSNVLGWSSGDPSGAATDTAIARNGAGIVEINNGTAGTFAAIKSSTHTLTAAAPTVAAGQIGFGGTTSATATAGASITIPALAQGYVVINIAGTTAKIPYYNN